MTTYEFAIKKDILVSGKVIHTPVCRKKSKLGRFNIFPNSWNRITKIEERYTLLDLDWNPELSYKECEERIHGYQQVLLKKTENEVSTVEFHVLEEQEI